MREGGTGESKGERKHKQVTQAGRAVNILHMAEARKASVSEGGAGEREGRGKRNTINKK